jgi:hypothetical protein
MGWVTFNHDLEVKAAGKFYSHPILLDLNSLTVISTLRLWEKNYVKFVCCK